jgi:hypothetical protein
LCAGIASQFLYRAQKNVVNSRTLNAICPGNLNTRLINNEDEIQNYSCPTFIRLSVPSWHGGFIRNMGEEEMKEEEELRF